MARRPWVSPQYLPLFIESWVRLARETFHEVPPQVWVQTMLMFYYPLIYLNDAACRSDILHVGRKIDLKVATTSVIIISPLLHMILGRYALKCIFWKASKSKPSRLDESNDAQTGSHELFNTNVQVGLREEEVSERRKRHGLNETRFRMNWIAWLCRTSFQGPNLLIEATALTAVILHDLWHLTALCALLALSLHLSYSQERDSVDVLELLGGTVDMTAIVLREGAISQVNAKELVPGDIVYVSQNTLVPADGRLVAFDGTIDLDQSAITGEMDAVEKYPGDMCYRTTGVVRGDAYLIVIDTGLQTFIGRTMSSVKSSATQDIESRKKVEHDSVLRFIGGIVLALIAVPISIGPMFAGSGGPRHQSLRLSAILAVLAVKYSGISTITSYRSSGAARLTNDFCIVHKLQDVESLAGIDILCTEITGTITENRLTLLEPYCVSGDLEQLMMVAGLCSSPEKDKSNPIDQAIAKALKQYPQAKASVDRHKVLDWQRLDEETVRIECLVESPFGERTLCVRGAPSAILQLYLQDHSDDATIQNSFTGAIQDFVRRGLQPLGIACKREKQKWELLGAIVMFDPPRFDTSSSLGLAREMGVAIKMLTGRPTITASLFAQSVGIGSDLLDGNSIPDVSQNAKLVSRIKTASGYANTSSTQKEKIIEVLQSCGNRVAVTGDGANDVSTLRRADCGIAVAGATEAAVHAADMVIVKGSGLPTMVRAIRTSRQIFQQVHNHLAQQTILSLYVMIFMLWYFAAYGEARNLHLLLISTNAGDLINSICRSSSEDVPFSKKPVRWSLGRLLIEVFPLVITLTAASCLGVLVIPSRGRTLSNHTITTILEGVSSTRVEALSLQILLSQHGLSLLMYTDGRFWAWEQNWRALQGFLCVDVLTTMLCVAGWAGQGLRMSLISASWVWLVSLGSLGVAAAVRYVTVRGQLTDRLSTTKAG